MRASVGLWTAPSSRPIAVVCAFVLVMGSIAGQASAATVMIDVFTHPDPAEFFMVPTGTNPSLQITQVVPGVIGGQRDSLFQVIGEGAINSATGLIGNDSGLTAYQLGTVGMSPTIATLQYAGIHNLNTPTSLVNPELLGGVDLTDEGANDRFLFQFVSSDALPVVDGLDMVITITSPSGSSTVTVDVQNSQAPFDVVVLFNQLVGTASPSNVDSITIAFNSIRQTPNIDFELQGIFAVPEPTGYLAMSLGGALVFSTSLLRRISRRRS
jgi:hypothetical protein